jgi:hypothetical protein
MWIRRIFFLLAVLYVLPFWIVEYIPTLDGPCHTYNAWILRQYGNTEEFPLFQQYYGINTKPYPNWAGHGTMALLMFAVPPLIAEKLLVSGYALLLLFGVWYLVGGVRPDQRWPAFLAFPFVYNLMFQFGFYNFSLSLALFPWILGLWWRNRASPTLAFAVKINLLLWVCWFSHVVSFTLALLLIAVLWLATLRRETWRRHLRHIPLLAPQILLPLWYFSDRGTATAPANWPFDLTLRYFFNLDALITFSEAQHWFAKGVVLVFALLTILTLWREHFRAARERRRVFREEDVFLLLAVLLMVLYFVSPDGMAGGSLLKNRLSLYPWLLLIPWFSLRLDRAALWTMVTALALAATLNLGFQLRWYDRLDGEMGQYLAGLEAVEPDSRLLPLLFARNGSSSRVSIFGHAASYAAIEKGLVDWDNYEASVAFFPIYFLPSAPPPPIWYIEATPDKLHVRPWSRRADFIYTWKLPPGHPMARRLKKYFVRISDKNGGVLWEQRYRRREARD